MQKNAYFYCLSPRGSIRFMHLNCLPGALASKSRLVTGQFAHTLLSRAYFVLLAAQLVCCLWEWREWGVGWKIREDLQKSAKWQNQKRVFKTLSAVLSCRFLLSKRVVPLGTTCNVLRTGFCRCKAKERERKAWLNKRNCCRISLSICQHISPKGGFRFLCCQLWTFDPLLPYIISYSTDFLSLVSSVGKLTRWKIREPPSNNLAGKVFRKKMSRRKQSSKTCKRGGCCFPPECKLSGACFFADRSWTGFPLDMSLKRVFRNNVEV